LAKNFKLILCSTVLMFGGYSHCKKRKKCGFSSSTTKHKKHKANEKRRFNRKAWEMNLFSPWGLDSADVRRNKFVQIH